MEARTFEDDPVDMLDCRVNSEKASKCYELDDYSALLSLRGLGGDCYFNGSDTYWVGRQSEDDWKGLKQGLAKRF